MKKTICTIAAIFLAFCSSGDTQKKIDPARPHVTVEFAFNTESYHSFIKKFYPQIAVWITQKGSAVQTVYVTAKGAKEDWFGADRRPSALPVWRGIYTSEKKTPIDSVSGATPSSTTYRIAFNLPGTFSQERPLDVFIEANISFDFNSFYRKDAPKDSPGFSGVNGQPSLIWQGTLELKDQGSVTPKLIGRGSVTGKESRIYSDLKGITTAKDIFTYIRIYFYKPEKK